MNYNNKNYNYLGHCIINNALNLILKKLKNNTRKLILLNNILIIKLIKIEK